MQRSEVGRLAARVALLLALSPAVVFAQPDWLVVVDLTDPGAAANQNRLISLPGDTPGVHAALSGNCGAGAPWPNPGLNAARNAVGDSSTRWVGSKGEKLEIYTFYDGSTVTPTLKVDEQRRQTQLASDLKTLLKLARALAMPAVEAPATIDCRRSEYTLKEVRARLSIGAQATDNTTGEVAMEASANLITGPREHLFLSTDVVLNKVSELKFNEESQRLELEEKPSKFLVGFNYMVGDLQSSSHSRLLDGLVVKLFVEASSRPRDSIGAALGYRFRSAKVAGLQLDGFSPFVGVIRTEDDKVDQSTMEVVGSDSELEFVAGISLNLDKALEWVKGSGSGES